MRPAMGSLCLSGLDVFFCDKVGDQSLAYIVQGLDGLKSLFGCHLLRSFNGPEPGGPESTDKKVKERERG